MLRLPRRFIFFCLAGMSCGVAVGQPVLGPPIAKARVHADLGQLPLSFEVAEDGSSFLARGSGYSVRLTTDGALLQLGTDDAVAMSLEGAQASKPAASDRLPGTVNYILGNDPKRWRTNIPTYAKIVYKGVYPGVDLVYYGNHRALEYDLIVAPGASATRIRLRLDGAKLSLEANGDLKITGQHGTIAFHQPVAFQPSGAAMNQVRARFVKISDTEIGFALGHYDHTRPLVIDPQIAYSTYFNNAYSTGIAADSAGSAYITGYTVSEFISGATAANLPVTAGAFETTDPESTPAPTMYNPHPSRYDCAFVTKFSPDGQSLIYSTYLGGSTGDFGYAIAVDGAGNAYVTGLTNSIDFPVTAGAFQTSPRSMFVAKVNPAGNGLVYSTYLGGTKYSSDEPSGIAVDANEEAYVTGTAYTMDFPVTPGAYQTFNKALGNFTSNVFVTKFNAAGTGLLYSTYIGGSGLAVEGYMLGPIEPDSSTTIDPEGNILQHYPIVSYTPLRNVGDQPTGIAVDGTGNAYIVGNTGSLDYPTTHALQSTNGTNLPGRVGPVAAPFVTKLNPTGTELVYSTFLGGSGTVYDTGEPLVSGAPYIVEFNDTLNAIAVDGAGDAFVAGRSGSSDYPVTNGAVQTMNTEINPNEGFFTSVFSELNPDGTLAYSTYLGGSTSPNQPLFEEGARGIAVDGNNNVYITGSTDASDFPVTSDAFEPTFRAVPNPFLQYQGVQTNAYFSVVNTASSKLVYSTYLGGTISDEGSGIAYSAPAVYLLGNTSSFDFPITPDAFQTSLQSTPTRIAGRIFYGSAGFITKIDVNQSGKILTRTALTTSPAANGQTTLLATVTPLTIAAGPPLGGTVAFYNNGTAIGSPVPVGNPVTTATLTTTLAAGTTSLTCAYSGDATYAPSNCALQPDFSIAAASPTVTVQSGGNVTTSAMLASIGGFTDTVGVACTNITVHLTCQITPASGSLVAYGSSTVSIYLDTHPTAASAQNRSPSRSPIQLAFLLLPVGLLAGRRLRSRRLTAVCCALALSLASMAVTGCSEIIVPYVLPAGTYTIPITGTAQSSGITHTAQFTLVVTP